MIPRVAHVIWVGGAPMPEKETACLERNREVLSHYDLLSPRNWRLEHRKAGVVDDFTVGHIVIDCVA